MMRFSWIHALFSLLLVINVAHAFSWPKSLTARGAHKKVALPDLYEASVVELQVRQSYLCLVIYWTYRRQAGLDAGHFTSVDLVKVSKCTHYFCDS